MDTYENYRQLGYAIAIQAAKDYEKIDGKITSPQKRVAIVKCLRSDYMNLITNGVSNHLADALRRDYKAVVARIKNMELQEDENV